METPGSELNIERYELYYDDGGHGGPYQGLVVAWERAELSEKERPELPDCTLVLNPVDSY